MAAKVEIFLCYAREEESLRKELEKHLSLLRKQDIIRLWYDREIHAGTEWEPEIKNHLDSAQIILLLVSPDFMHSDYCYGIEMKRAMQRHELGEACVIPIILRPVYWKGAPFGSLQVLPTDGTIPARRQSCERLLNELARQARRPDGVILVLDGYGEAPAPMCPLPVIAEYRSANLSSPGARWRVASDLPPDDILICLDDDIVLLEAPRLVFALVAAVELHGGAAAAMGRDADGKGASPGLVSRGELLYAAGCGLTARAGALVGVEKLAADVLAAGGPNTLGPLGDDDAMVSAHLWKTGVKIRHAATGNIYAAPTTRTTSQTAARLLKREVPDAQKLAIRKATGWPWPSKFVPAKHVVKPIARTSFVARPTHDRPVVVVAKPTVVKPGGQV